MIDNFKLFKPQQGVDHNALNAFCQWIENILNGGMTGANFKEIDIEHTTGCINQNGDTLAVDLDIENGARIDGVNPQVLADRLTRMKNALEKTMTIDTRAHEIEDGQAVPLWDGVPMEEGFRAYCQFAYYFWGDLDEAPHSGIHQPTITRPSTYADARVLAFRTWLNSPLVGKNYLLCLRRHAKNLER